MELLKPEREETFVTFSSSLTPLHQVLICRTHVLPQPRQFWNTLRQELSAEGPYKASIGGRKLRLHELQEEDSQAQKIRAEKSEGREDTGVLHHQGLPYELEIVRTELISRHRDDPLTGHFGIERRRELIARKCYWGTLCRNDEAYVKGWSVCLSSKDVRHKPCGDPPLLPIRTHRWKDLSMDFVTGFPVYTDWKGDRYDLILVLVDRLQKRYTMSRCKSRIITAPALAEVILDVAVRHRGLPDSISHARSSHRCATSIGTKKRRLSSTVSPQNRSADEDGLQGLSSSSVVTTHPRPPTKKTSTLAQGPKQQMSSTVELRDPMTTCRENFNHAQEVQKLLGWTLILANNEESENVDQLDFDIGKRGGVRERFSTGL